MVGRARFDWYLNDLVAPDTCDAVGEARIAAASSHAERKWSPLCVALDAVSSGIGGEGQLIDRMVGMHERWGIH